MVPIIIVSAIALLYWDVKVSAPGSPLIVAGMTKSGQTVVMQSARPVAQGTTISASPPLPTMSQPVMHIVASTLSEAIPTTVSGVDMEIFKAGTATMELL